MKFQSISIDYLRSVIEFTSYDPAVYGLLEHSKALYFGGGFNAPELRAESFKDCIAVDVRLANFTQTMTGKEVRAILNITKQPLSRTA